MKIVVTGSPFVQIHVVKAPVRRIIPRMANFALASGYRLPYQENVVEHITFSERKMVNKASKSKGLFTWYRNNFHSGMSFVPEWSSYCIHVIKSTGSALGVFRLRFFFFARSDKLAPLTPKLHDLPFSISLHDTTMKRTRKRILFGMKTGVSHSGIM